MGYSFKLRLHKAGLSSLPAMSRPQLPPNLRLDETTQKVIWFGSAFDSTDPGVRSKLEKRLRSAHGLYSKSFQFDPRPVIGLNLREHATGTSHLTSGGGRNQ